MLKRHLIFFALIACILFLIGLAVNLRAHEDKVMWRCSAAKVRSSQEFSALCMELWTKIDLLQAINAHERYKEEILKEFTKSIERLYRCSNKIKQKIYRSRHSSGPDTIMLIYAIKEAYETVFKESTNEHFKASLALLNRTIDQLITPVDVDSQIAT